MKKVMINIPKDESSIYGKKTYTVSGEEIISMLRKKVNDTNLIFFGDNEFISLLYD